MALSRLWTVKRIVNYVQGQLGAIDPIAYVQRYELLNEIQARIASSFYAIVNSAYSTAVVVQEDVTGKLITGTNTGTWTAATSALYSASWSSAPAAGDVGKVVMFAVGTDVYLGFVSSVGTNIFYVEGTNLPATDQTVAEAMVAVSTLSSSVINIAAINVMRSGEQVRIHLESTETDRVTPLGSLEEFKAWRDSALDNRNKIVWTMVGDQILLQKGSSLTTYGTITLRYPRVPTEVDQDTDYVDLPDGALTSLALVMFRKALVDRYGAVSKGDLNAELQAAVAGVYRAYGQNLSAEELEVKIEALK